MGTKKKASPVKSRTPEKDKEKKSSHVPSTSQRRKAVVSEDKNEIEDDEDADTDEPEEEEEIEAPVKMGKVAPLLNKGKDKAKKGLKNSATALVGKDGQKLTRLAMIKVRHESMRREIDQIREDLESEEDE